MLVQFSASAAQDGTWGCRRDGINQFSTVGELLLHTHKTCQGLILDHRIKFGHESHPEGCVQSCFIEKVLKVNQLTQETAESVTLLVKRVCHLEP